MKKLKRSIYLLLVIGLIVNSMNPLTSAFAKKQLDEKSAQLQEILGESVIICYSWSDGFIDTKNILDKNHHNPHHHCPLCTISDITKNSLVETKKIIISFQGFKHHHYTDLRKSLFIQSNLNKNFNNRAPPQFS